MIDYFFVTGFQRPMKKKSIVGEYNYGFIRELSVFCCNISPSMSKSRPIYEYCLYI